MAAGSPGWVGTRVDLLSVGPDGARAVAARVSLDAAGGIACDRADLLARWAKEGVIGRGDRGRVFPRDGQAFLDELPFAYRSPYLMAVPRREAEVVS